MDWVRDHYNEQSRLFGRALITDQHRVIAAGIDRWCQRLPRCEKILELGAGACGVAGALAGRGYDVFAVEFNPHDIALAQELKMSQELESLRVVEADFYEVELPHRFDFVFYWDGFGVGDDSDQRRLLDRIGNEWLAAGGWVLIDVFSPWNWQRRDGEVTEFTATDGSKWTRLLEFDAVRGRFVDHLRPTDGSDRELSQTIRVYTLQEFELLTEGTALRVDSFHLFDEAPDDSARLPPIIDSQVADASLSHRLLSTNGYLASLVRR